MSPQRGDDVEDRGGHRTPYSEQTRAVRKPGREEEESCGRAIQEVKADPPTVHGRPK